MRLICESCQHGYAPTLNQCPHCGAGTHVAHSSEVVSAFNIESYVDYFCATFVPTGEVFQMFDGHPLDIDGLRRALSRYTCITFNGIAYDMVVTAGALAGRSCAELKAIGDALIVENMSWWEVLNKFDLPRTDWVDHIDIMNVLPGQGSLNAYGAKIHYPWLQDQPIDVNARLNWYQRTVIREHCIRNCDISLELYKRFGAQLKLRAEMSEEYGIDLRSKSDAQIAEAVMKQLLAFKVKVPYYSAGTQFYYRPPPWIKFISLDLVERLAQLPFSINPKGSPVPHIDADFIDWGADQVRLDAHGYYVKRPKGYISNGVVIAGKTYTMGSGGLHSNEYSVTNVADATVVLRDHDVSSYYPKLLEVSNSYPPQIGEIFRDIYVGWIYSRIEDKNRATELKAELKDLKKQLANLP